jgi:hypothetical protein
LLDWPKINGQTLGAQSSVPELISYIYTFALAICGITALVSIVYGAAQYAFSAGNSSKAEDAKNRITQALLGIVILLFAVLILNTINPDLIRLTLGSSTTSNPPATNTTNYYCYGQCGTNPFRCKLMTGVSSQDEAQKQCYALTLGECGGFSLTAIAKTQPCP